MEAGVYSLVNSPADVATQYRSLFTSPSVLKQEVKMCIRDSPTNVR